MTEIERDHLLTDTLDFVSRDARCLVLDSVYCTLFNAAGTIDGNTEASDVEWFARQIHEEVNGWRNQWEQVPEEVREEWRRIARAALVRLPYLMSRIAHRCQATAQARANSVAPSASPNPRR